MTSHPQVTLIHNSFAEVECPEPVEGLFYVYILICSNSTFYVGVSENVENRIWTHLRGKGATWTKVSKSLKLIYVEGPVDPKIVFRRERQLKKWSRAKKVALINGDYQRLKELSKGSC